MAENVAFLKPVRSEVHNDLDTLIRLMAKLPGLGARSARRSALHLLKHREDVMLPLARALEQAAEAVKECTECGNLDMVSPCAICTDPKRDRTTLCVVEEVADLWAFERGAMFRGLYHVLGGTLSALDGRGPEALRIPLLADRASRPGMAEVILATNATLNGQVTAHYLTERLQGFPIRITRLAYGIPLGGELDYLDDGTLAAALKSRQDF